MSRFLLDEMFPVAAAELLRERFGREAVHVSEVGLRATEDAEIAASARAQGWALVTENVVDFAVERDLVLIFVLKRSLPSGSAQAAGLAALVDRWATGNPEPYRGHHWPSYRPGL